MAKLRHIAMQVPDLEKAARFYEETFELKRVKTAESHRTRIMAKLDLHETANLVRYAIRRGLVNP